MQHLNEPGMESASKAMSAAAVWHDMFRRRSNGERVRVEDYLDRLPDAGDESMVLDLVYAEYAMRRDSGESPSIQEYADRFPKFAAAIKRQFHVHNGMETSLGNSTSTNAGRSDVILAPTVSPEEGPIRIGKYLVLSQLSSGGQATVYRALHEILSREVVIKLSRRSLAQDSFAATRVLEEGRILAELDHPNLARVYDMGIHDGCPYLAMEYVRGRTLEQYASEEKLNTLDIVHIVRQVAAAVAAAHAKNTVHLDIKPRNVVVDEQGTPRLLDFGLSKIRDAFHEGDGCNAISGTLQYMAPEQARGEVAKIGRRTDVFALGGLLYVLLTRKAPFYGDTTSELLSHVAKNEWNRQLLESSNVPRPLRVICSRAMSEKIEERYVSPAEFAAALHRFEKRERRLPLLWKGIAAAAVLLAALLALRFFPTRELVVPPTLMATVRSPDGRYLQLADALPLQNGDELKFRTEIPADVHATMFLFTSSGTSELLQSWMPANEPRELLFPPAANDSAPLIGPAGTEIVLVCTSADAPITLEDFREAWQNAEPLEALPGYTIAVIDPSGTRFENYGKGLGPATVRDDPQESVRQKLVPILDRLSARFTSFAGIAFAHNE